MRRWLPGRHGRTVCNEKGQAALEFAFVVPFLLAFVFLFVEGVSFVNAYSLVELASREGARYGALGNTQSDTQSCTANTITTPSGHLLSSSNVTVSYPAGGNGLSQETGDPVKVSVSYTYTFQSPLADLWKFLSGQTLTTPQLPPAVTVMRLEAGVGSASGTGAKCPYT